MCVTRCKLPGGLSVPLDFARDFVQRASYVILRLLYWLGNICGNEPWRIFSPAKSMPTVAALAWPRELKHYHSDSYS